MNPVVTGLLQLLDDIASAILPRTPSTLDSPDRRHPPPNLPSSGGVVDMSMYGALLWGRQDEVDEVKESKYHESFIKKLLVRDDDGDDDDDDDDDDNHNTSSTSKVLQTTTSATKSTKTTETTSSSTLPPSPPNPKSTDTTKLPFTTDKSTTNTIPTSPTSTTKLSSTSTTSTTSQSVQSSSSSTSALLTSFALTTATNPSALSATSALLSSSSTAAATQTLSSSRNTTLPSAAQGISDTNDTSIGTFLGISAAISGSIAILASIIIYFYRKKYPQTPLSRGVSTHPSEQLSKATRPSSVASSAQRASYIRNGPPPPMSSQGSVARAGRGEGASHASKLPAVFRATNISDPASQGKSDEPLVPQSCEHPPRLQNTYPGMFPAGPKTNIPPRSPANVIFRSSNGRFDTDIVEPGIQGGRSGSPLQGHPNGLATHPVASPLGPLGNGGDAFKLATSAEGTNEEDASKRQTTGPSLDEMAMKGRDTSSEESTERTESTSILAGVEILPHYHGSPGVFNSQDQIQTPFQPTQAGYADKGALLVEKLPCTAVAPLDDSSSLVAQASDLIAGIPLQSPLLAGTAAFSVSEAHRVDRHQTQERTFSEKEPRELVVDMGERTPSLSLGSQQMSNVNNLESPKLNIEPQERDLEKGEAEVATEGGSLAQTLVRRKGEGKVPKDRESSGSMESLPKWKDAIAWVRDQAVRRNMKRLPG